MTPQEKKQIGDNMALSLLRLRNLLKACKHDVDYIKEYQNLIEEKEMVGAIKRAFPSISFLIKLLDKNLSTLQYSRPKLLEDNEELTYKILEHYEEIIKEI
tara:strand:- start:4661 stop:4963 length:303 start_codon:yes stop_codon:yes gene_type:complete